ncbi:Hypothetical protein NTJ_02184 [Nesidiocoris tenuis]|uniref:Uncharacterized protein n=1 Tax=Nesidiocoris tenuis TaxID=355587 RepID=A0ABN7AGA8_9HEMI|nr:Hypothetical protein NTJ_02184 [Nesidiocoris tenuis]
MAKGRARNGEQSPSVTMGLYSLPRCYRSGRDYLNNGSPDYAVVININELLSVEHQEEMAIDPHYRPFFLESTTAPSPSRRIRLPSRKGIITSSGKAGSEILKIREVFNSRTKYLKPGSGRN